MNWQVIVCRVWSGDELEGLRWRIEFRVFQSVRGLEDDSVTRFVRKLLEQKSLQFALKLLVWAVLIIIIIIIITYYALK